MPLYQVAIIEKKKKKDEPTEEVLILAPTAILAKDPQSAAITAVMQNKDIKFDPARSEVLVRPF
jgi:hypothetical protein